MAKNIASTLILLILLFRPKSATRDTPWKSFCESGQPSEINATAGAGKGEVTIEELKTEKSWLIHVNKEDIHGIELKVNDFELEDFFLVIQDGCPNTNPDSTVQFISGTSSEAMTFRIPFGKSFHMEICPENAITTNLVPAKFNLTFKRIDRTRQDGLPDDVIPQDFCEIQFKGHTMKKFEDENFRGLFQKAVKNMARDYCATFGIDFTDERTAEEMVNIIKVMECPPEWFESCCVSVRHSVFVSKEKDSETMRTSWKNELTFKNLIRMWELYDDAYIKNLGLSVFKLKDKNSTYGWWLTVIVLPLILFTFVVIIMKRSFDNFFIDPGKNLSTKTDSKINEKRRREILKPNEYQRMPSFMRNATKSGRGDVTDGSNVDRPMFSPAMFFFIDRLTRKNVDNSQGAPTS